MERVFRKHKLIYPIPITTETEPPLRGFPWLRPRDFLKTLHDFRDLGHILGGHSSLAEAKLVLCTFWSRFRKICPEFQVFSEFDCGRLRPEQSVPLYVHGDEGVSFKKGGILILSFQSPIGFGTSKRDMQLYDTLQSLGEPAFPLNFLKSGMYTRMLMVMCQKVRV